MSQTGSSTVGTPTHVVQSEKQVLDISAFSGLDLELRTYSLSQTNWVSGTTSKLYLETSMQKEDMTTHNLWTPLDPNGLDLHSFEGTNIATIFTATSSLGRYLRWRIEIPGAATALVLSAVFQITGFGRS